VDERPPVTVFFHGTSYPTPEQLKMPSDIGCNDCLAYWTPELTNACASAGIEHGKSTYQMIREYLAAHHERGHRKA
jgi:hypothetical protein